jgi:hypothetical protein
MIINIITIIAIAWLIVNFEPFQFFISRLNVKPRFDFFLQVFSCYKCAALWTGLIFFWDFPSAVIASMLISVMEYKNLIP